MTSAAKAMYPNLPSASDRPVNEKAAGGKPDWGKSNDPMWQSPQQRGKAPMTVEGYRITSYWLNRRSR